MVTVCDDSRATESDDLDAFDVGERDDTARRSVAELLGTIGRRIRRGPAGRVTDELIDLDGFGELTDPGLEGVRISRWGLAVA